MCDTHQPVAWHVADDRLLMHLTSASRAWRDIARRFPGRTVDAVRNRFMRISKTNHVRPPKQRCGACGAYRRGHICEAMLYCHEELSPPVSPASPAPPEATVTSPPAPAPPEVARDVAAGAGASEAPMTSPLVPAPPEATMTSPPVPRRDPPSVLLSASRMTTTDGRRVA